MTTQPTSHTPHRVGPLPAPPIDEILHHACRAPSVHNSQPWLWRVSGNQIDLFADLRRQLMYADPQRRDLVISCGAALHHLQTAAAALGWPARVQRMPDPADERHLARVTLKPTRPRENHDAVLASIMGRHTDRRSLTSWPVPHQRLASLSATGSLWGAQVLPVTRDSVKRQLHHLTHRASVIQSRNHRYIEELAASTLGTATDGMGPAVIPERGEPATTTVNRAFPNGILPNPPVDEKPSEEALLLVCTSSDDVISRLRAGEALSAVWLHATDDGLALVPLSQAIEVDETRHVLQSDVLGDLAFPQLLLRVGWLPLGRDNLPDTPRRPLDDVVEHI